MPRVTIEEVLNCTEWKTCTKCDEEKKAVMFSMSKGKRRPECKACDAKAYKARKAKKALVAEQPKHSLFKRLVALILG